MMKINFYYKLIITYVVLFAVLFFSMYLYINNLLKTNAYNHLKGNLVKESKLIKSTFEKGYLKFRPSGKMDVLADEMGRELNLRVTMINLNGMVLGDSELEVSELASVGNHLYRPEIQQAISAGIGESIRFSIAANKYMLYVAVIVGETGVQWVLRLAVPISEIEPISDNLRNLLLISLVTAFFAAVIIGVAASRYITRPIKEIALIANSIALGDYSKSIRFIPNKEVRELAKTFNYMTSQIQARIREVKVSNSRFEAVLLSMFEGVMVVDQKGIILLMNQRLKDFFLVTKDPVGKKVLEVIRNSAAQEIVDKSLKLRQGVDSHEISLSLEEEKILLVHAAPIILKGENEGSVLVFHDMTELRHLENVRRDFVVNVSHELRTPVTSIKGYAETLLDGALMDKENAIDFLEIIYSVSGRMSRLVDDLLDLARIESGKMQFILGSLSVEKIVSQVVASFNKKMTDSSILIKIDISKDLPMIRADEGRIGQVLQNLVDNAVKYNHENGIVTIRAEEKGEFVQIDVIDTGVGILDKDIPRLFERFYRVDRARSRELGGTGLGLSIVKHIVQYHKGQVYVQSKYGVGTTFTLLIPKA